jgi:hypothetical protein
MIDATRDGIGRGEDYVPVGTDGAARAAAMIADLVSRLRLGDAGGLSREYGRTNASVLARETTSP